MKNKIINISPAYKYWLYNCDTFNGSQTKIIAMSNNLEELRKYAFNLFCQNNDPEYDKEIVVGKSKSTIYFYENRGGQYQGSGYQSHGKIVIAPTYKDITIIE